MNALFKLNWSSYLPFQEKGGPQSPTSHFLWRHCHLKCNRSPRPYQAANKNEPWMTWFPKIRFGYLKSSYPIKFFIKNFMPRTGWRELIRKHFKLAWFLSENTCKTIVRFFFIYFSYHFFIVAESNWDPFSAFPKHLKCDEFRGRFVFVCSNETTATTTTAWLRTQASHGFRAVFSRNTLVNDHVPTIE